jgi:hypothetical protein
MVGKTVYEGRKASESACECLPKTWQSEYTERATMSLQP